MKTLNIRNRFSLFPFLMSTLLLVAGCHSVTAPLADHPRLCAGVRMQDVSFESASLGRSMSYRVVLPAQPATTPLRVVFLLHGNGENLRIWTNESDVAKYALPGTALVMPEGGSSFFINAVKASKDKYQDYLTRDLIADVEQRFPVRRDRAGRAIVGDSMGGYGAIEAGLAHPELYAFVGALSPAVETPGRATSWKHIGQWWQLRRVFGAAGSPERQALDPFLQIRSANASSAPYFYITAGQSEPMMKSIHHFAGQLSAHGFQYVFHSKPGGHNWEQWNEQIPGCFAKLPETLK